MKSKFKSLFMVIVIFTTVFTVLMPVEVNAEDPPLIEWVDQFGSTSIDRSHGVATGASSVYVVGGANGALPGQTHKGSTDAFISKYDSSGSIQWTDQFGSSGSDEAYGVSVIDSSVYVAATLANPASPGDIDAAIRKYNSDGTMLWTNLIGTSGYDTAFGIAVDVSGVYAVGLTTGTLPSQASLGGWDAFVCKYDHNGYHQWTRQFGTSSKDEAFGVSLDGSYLYVTGFTEGGLAGSNAGGKDIFVRKYDINGNYIWTQQIGTPGDDIARGISVHNGGIYLAGETSGTLPSQTQLGDIDAFTLKYDPTGNHQWTHQFGSSQLDRAFGIFADASGIYVAGGTNGALPGQVNLGGRDSYIRKYDSNGNHIWTNQFGSTSIASSEAILGIFVDSSNIYVAGETFGEFIGENSAGLCDAFVGLFSSFGPNLVADAGIDQIVSMRDVVVLDGSASSGQSFHWEQIQNSPMDPESPWVTLTGENTPISTFIAPSYEEGGSVESLIFQLTVSDGIGNSRSDILVITIVEDLDHAIFLSTSLGDDINNDGSKDDPVQSLAKAFELASQTMSHSDIYIDEGDYYETETTLTILDDMSIYGGFSTTMWNSNIDWERARTPDPANTHIFGTTTALKVLDIVSPTVINGLTINSANGLNGVRVNGSSSQARAPAPPPPPKAP